MSGKYYYGLDISINGTGIVKADKDFNVVDVWYMSKTKSDGEIMKWVNYPTFYLHDKWKTAPRWEKFSEIAKEIFAFIVDPIEIAVEANNNLGTGQIVDMWNHHGGILMHYAIQDIKINEYAIRKIKLVAGKGSLDKVGMNKAIRNNHPDFYTELQELYDEGMKKFGGSPSEDIVDAFWIIQTLKQDILQRK